MPDKSIPESDPIVSKSLAPHYFVSIVILMATLFWALWDEDFGQRPWKNFQEEWKNRYSAFLSAARSKSSTSEKEVEGSAEYQALKKAFDKANEDAASRLKEINAKLRDNGAAVLALQNAFTDRRAYVNALTYDIETETSVSSKLHKQEMLNKYKNEEAVVEFPNGSKRTYNFDQLEETYNDLKSERTKLSLELSDVIKPVNEQKDKVDAYVSEHMVDLTPTQISGLQKKTEAWEPKILQINVPAANIVDRCESCHMGIREPVKLTAASMAP